MDGELSYHGAKAIRAKARPFVTEDNRLTLDMISDILFDMRTNVSTLLREFPRVRRAALAGEEVIIETREGNLVLTAQVAENVPLYGSMKDQVVSSSDDLDSPTMPDSEWEPKL